MGVGVGVRYIDGIVKKIEVMILGTCMRKKDRQSAK